MATLTISIESDDEFFAGAEADVRRVEGAGKPGDRTYSFDSIPTLFRTLSPKRWELVAKLQEVGPCSVRALARALDRDVKRVHEDAALLLERRLIKRTEDNKLVVPYDEVRIDAVVATRAA